MVGALCRCRTGSPAVNTVDKVLSKAPVSRGTELNFGSVVGFPVRARCPIGVVRALTYKVVGLDDRQHAFPADINRAIGLELVLEKKANLERCYAGFDTSFSVFCRWQRGKYQR